jgi:signal recognition particle subunit SRP19
MRESGFHYVYPAYFEASRSRKSGRRIPKKLALPSVDVALIVLAARRLKLEFKVKEEARYPASWWGTPGLVLIRKTAERPKTKLLKELAEKMKVLKRKTGSK